MAEEKDKQPQNLPEADPTGIKNKISQKEQERTKTSNALFEAMNTAPGQTVTTGLISFIVVVLLFFFAITPAISSITRQLKVNSALKERNGKLESKLQSLTNLTQKEQNLATQLDEFESTLGTEKHQDLIYDELTDLANSSRMDFRGITFEVTKPNEIKYAELEPNEKLKIQTVRLTVVGQQGNLDKLIASIEASRRIMDVTDVIVTTDESNNNLVLVNISINTFYWQTEDDTL